MILNKYMKALKGNMVVTEDDHECMFCLCKIPEGTSVLAITVVQVPRGRIESGWICDKEQCSGLTPKVYAEMQKVLKYSTEFKHGRH